MSIWNTKSFFDQDRALQNTHFESSSWNSPPSQAEADQVTYIKSTLASKRKSHCLHLAAVSYRLESGIESLAQKSLACSHRPRGMHASCSLEERRLSWRPEMNFRFATAFCPICINLKQHRYGSSDPF
ncbi:hypothetical protein AVEN_122807-1 [Araneus ventricosus]|uniref:Uncharacterized protein n=1 Tax=Araneus ventricosus TaxID=182803 RepID=A0A4Y2VPC5_ARAVE|nr:hypothetical protein AVEN_122807-1 [Araneus ventricosus]